MSEEVLLRHCAPTLAGIKTGNMFTVRFENREQLLDSLRGLNRRFAGKGLRVVPLRIGCGSALVYLYRPKKLAADLEQAPARRILEENGYAPACPEQCVGCLRRRMARGAAFPHEVGLFLGYPPEDVSGFIENDAKNAKCVGAWKVYGDEDQAKRTFAKYKKCTDVYLTLWAQGRSIDRLTVAG